MLLFLRTRHALTLAVTLLTLVIVGTFVTTVIFRPTAQSEMRIPMGLILPLIPAVVLGATSVVPTLRMRECRAERLLWRWQAIWLSAATIVTAAVLALGTQQLLTVGYGAVSVARNCVGLIGLALIGSTLLGPALSWSIPLAWLIIPGYVYANIYADHAGVLTFFAQPDARLSSLITAAALFTAGLVGRSLTPRRALLRVFFRRGQPTRSVSMRSPLASRKD